MSSVAFVQARMGSTRFPGKVMAPIEGRPALAWVVERVAATPSIDEVVLVIPEGDANEPLSKLARSLDVRCFAGAELDVLDRFHRAVRVVSAETVVRITGDCPLADPEVIERVISLYRNRDVDYACVATGARPASSGLRRYPDGLDAEVVGAAVLETAWRESIDASEREHVTEFVTRRFERFRLGVLEADVDMGDERWTVDHPGDLGFVREIYARFAPRYAFGYRDVRSLLEQEPHLRDLNASDGRAQPAATDADPVA